jgi:hypothetical protein
MNETAKNQWNGEYPIFIEWKDQYEWTQFDIMHDEAQLIEFCDSHQLNPRELIYLNAQPIYACDGVFIDADELRFQGDLDAEVQMLIDEFKDKLRAIKRPIVYEPMNNPLEIPDAKLKDWYVRLNLE